MALLQSQVGQVVGEAAELLGDAGVAQIQHDVEAQRLEGRQVALPREVVELDTGWVLLVLWQTEHLQVVVTHKVLSLSLRAAHCKVLEEREQFCINDSNTKQIEMTFTFLPGSGRPRLPLCRGWSSRWSQSGVWCDSVWAGRTAGAGACQMSERCRVRSRWVRASPREAWRPLLVKRAEPPPPEPVQQTQQVHSMH